MVQEGKQFCQIKACVCILNKLVCVCVCAGIEDVYRALETGDVSVSRLCTSACCVISAPVLPLTKPLKFRSSGVVWIF